MNTCSGCQFHDRKVTQVQNGQWATLFFCTHPENIDPVDGSPLPCNVARTNVVFCGIQGKYWKKKEAEEVKGTEGKVIQLSHE